MRGRRGRPVGRGGPTAARSGEAAAAAAAPPTTAAPADPPLELPDVDPPADAGGGPPASRSAGLPARPWPSTALAARNSLATSGGAPAVPGLDPAPVPLAHGGGAAQSRGGFRRTGGSSPSGAWRGPSGRRDRRRSRGPGRIVIHIAVACPGRGPRGRCGTPDPCWTRGRRHRCRCASLLGPRHPARGPPRAAPNPGTSGRPGTRSTGSRLPGGRARAVRVETPRSIGGGGRGSSHDRRGRPRMPRTDKPGHRPCWAALAQSSGR